ncbi:MAG: phosphotransferase family protein [Ilumatobacteraceae bacterium]
MTTDTGTDATLRLPDDVSGWIADVTGGEVVAADRIPGGAMREGWFVDVRVGGAIEPLYLRYSAEPMPDRSAFHRLGVEAEMVKALRQAGTTVANVRAVHPTREAVLADRISGATWFYRIKDPDEQVRVAQDFIRNLAATHRLDPRDLDLPSFGPVLSAREHALERIRDIRARGTAPDGSIDPLLQLSADWLEHNVPDYDGPVVVVQGDTGPGNFMYEDGRVTAVVDWELSHFGDPMDDIAWLSLRTVQDTFTHLPDRLREYAELSGHAIDVERIWYYRLFAEATMFTLQPNEGDGDRDRGRPAQRDVGNSLMYPQLHRRLWLVALCRVMGLDLPLPEFPDPPPAREWASLYDDVLGALQTIVPRITDPLASQWTKGLARAVKYLQEIDRSGRDYDEVERGEIAAVLGHGSATLADARRELAAASQDGKVADEDYVRVLWNKVMRDDHLMRTASGALHDRTWPPLV